MYHGAIAWLSANQDQYAQQGLTPVKAGKKYFGTVQTALETLARGPLPWAK
jgi:hypothetical protein